MPLGLGAAARKAGATLFENSEVQTIEKGSTITIKCADGQVNAKHLIIACNGYIENLVPKVAARVMPMNNYIIATEPLDEGLARELIRDDLGVADSKFVVNYYRLSADKRMLFGGGETYSFKFPDDIKSFVRQPMLADLSSAERMRGSTMAGAGRWESRSTACPILPNSTKILSMPADFPAMAWPLPPLQAKLVADLIDGQASRFDAMEHVPTYPFPGGRHPAPRPSWSWRCSITR